MNTKGDMGEHIKSDYVLGPHGFFFFLSKIYSPGLVSLILSHMNTLCSIFFLLVPSQNTVKINVNIPPGVVELIASWNFSWIIKPHGLYCSQHTGRAQILTSVGEAKQGI